MKNFIKIYTILVGFVLIGCSIDLDETPPSLLSPNTFYNSESEFEAALAGTFRPLYAEWAGFDYAYPLIMTSGAEDVRSDASIFKNLDRLNAHGNDQSIINVWRQLYQSISNANAIIGNLEGADAISEKRLQEIEGQAKFIRAFCFFYLVRWFGEVQLTTFENQNDIENVKQSTVAEIYAAIISDLKVAETNLPERFSDYGRPTRGAAKALLSKVYLTMAGWPLEDTSKYALARDKAKEVMDSGTYSLVSHFADLWKEANKFNSEFIFAFYGSTASQGFSGSHMHTASRHWGNGEGGWGDFYSETRFYEAFPDGPRKDASFTSVFSDGTTFEEAGVQPHIAKYRDAGVSNPSKELNGQGFNVQLRYADVLLIYAEAANMAASGPSSEAYAAINQVRRRAQGVAIDSPDSAVDLPDGLSQPEFDTAVLEERNWELAFEMNRWFDLVRKKKVVEANTGVHSVGSERRLLPKPAAQLIPGVLEQNPGY